MTDPKPSADPSAAARIGGLALIAAAVLFIAAFSFLAGTFDYPDVLDRGPAEVLPRLLALGATGRAVWAIYGLLPLLLVPAGVGVARAFRRSAPGASTAALVFAAISALTMMLGLLRWPSIQWEIAQAWVAAPEGGTEHTGMTALFHGLNTYLGVFIGEFVGELTLNLFFSLTAWAMWRTPRAAGLRPFAWIGFVAAASGAIAMFRNATALVAPVAAVNDYVLPLALIGLGVGLMRAPSEARD